MEDKQFEREEFTRILTKCHNIIRNNDKLSPEAAFDEISKVLFVKIWKEKKGQTYTLELFDEEKRQSKVGGEYYQLLFYDTRKHYEGDKIFEKNERLNIRENSFRDIVSALGRLNLASASDDVRGIAFEQFLGRTFRGELGQFFTPRRIVEFMVQVLDPQEDELICDPCCGSGGFLIHAFEHVRDAIMADSMGNKEARVKKLASKCVYGVDANPRMARTAKMNMMMHGDGHSGVHHHDGFLNVNGIFENRFQVILTNPPFGSKVSKKLVIAESDRFTDTAKIKEYTKEYGERYKNALAQVENNIDKSLLSLFGISKYTNLTETLFLDRCLDLLVPGGRMGVVLPEGVLNNKKLAALFGFGDDDSSADTNDTDEELDDTVDENLDPSYGKEVKNSHRKKNSGSGSSTYDADGYLIWSIPWTMNLSYTMRYAYGTFNKSKMEYNYKLTHSATVSGTIQPTKGWNFSYNFTYDCNNHKVSYMNLSASRDMHCWSLSASMNPIGTYASFHVCIAVKSSMLQDLKYEKSSVSRSNKIDWYDD